MHIQYTVLYYNVLADTTVQLFEGGEPAQVADVLNTVE